MGADQFFTIGLGPNQHRAFDNAVRDAQWEYGHGGYTGTLAEKSGFKYFGEVDSWHYMKMPSYFDREVAKKYRESPKERLPGPVIPPKYKDQVRRLVDLYDDKWGPAICYQVTGTAAVKIKKQHQRRDSHDKVYVFMGYASS
jgi:hypothetical protein